MSDPVRKAAAVVIYEWQSGNVDAELDYAIQELKRAFSEPAPEPDAWMDSSGDVVVSLLGLSERMKTQFCTPLYAAPPAQPAPEKSK